MSTDLLAFSLIRDLQANIRKTAVQAQASAALKSLGSGSLVNLAKEMHDLTAPYAEATRQVQDLLAPLAEAFRRAQDMVAPYSEEMRQAQARINEFHKASFDYAGIVTQASAATARMERMFKNAGRIGQLGWTIGGDIPIPVLLRLSECQDRQQADAYMLGWYEEHDPELNLIEQKLFSVEELEPFRLPLKQSFEAFRLQRFALTIPLLISILEQALRHLGEPEHFSSTDIEKTVRKKYKSAKDREGEMAFDLWSLYEFTIEHYKQYRETEDSESRIRRKGVMHGLQPPPNRKIEVIRLFHVISTATDSYPDPWDYASQVLDNP